MAAHASKTFQFGFGKGDIMLSNLTKAYTFEDNHIFDKFAYKMLEIAQRKKIKTPFEFRSRFYAFDSTTTELCLRDFWWTFFKNTKSCIDIHTLSDVNVMNDVAYEPNTYCVFD